MLRYLLIFFIFNLPFLFQAHAQLSPESSPSKEEFAKNATKLPDLESRKSLETILAETTNGLPNIVLIGYWPPTNEMLREFNPHIQQNPGGWKGRNWENRGYNVYSFFPEFDGLGKGYGDFQVDYDDTSRDFWKFMGLVKPVAIMAFGRAMSNNHWEIEYVHLNRVNWFPDFSSGKELFPKPNPPDKSSKDYDRRHPKFPAPSVVDSLKKKLPSQIVPFIDESGAGGQFLCEYLGFHLSWYRSLNSAQVKSAAFIHVGFKTPLETLVVATRTTLRTVISTMNSEI